MEKNHVRVQWGSPLGQRRKGEGIMTPFSMGAKQDKHQWSVGDGTRYSVPETVMLRIVKLSWTSALSGPAVILGL